MLLGVAAFFFPVTLGGMEACLLTSLFPFSYAPISSSLPLQKSCHQILRWKSKHALKQRLSDLVLTRWEAPISWTTCFIDRSNGFWNVKSDFMRTDRILWSTTLGGNSGLNKHSEFSAEDRLESSMCYCTLQVFETWIEPSHLSRLL